MPTPLPDDDNHPGHLPRLADAAYRGKAIVHWTLTVRDRGTGWLDTRFTTRFRWLLLHACGRYGVDCPVHCLMPDHVHLLLHGNHREGDQRGLLRFLRRHSNPLLAETGHHWQPQAHDHVLRPEESDRYAYERLARYIMQNPVRAGLVKEAQEWPHTGVVIPGYPELKLWQPDYWPRYWRLRSSRAAL
jgi:putative transposase